VWCFDADELAKVIGPRWDAWEVPFLAEGERDIEKSAFTAQSHRWLTPQFNVRSPLRMASQQGLFTIASRLGEPHDRLIDELVPDGAKFVITIPPGSDKIGLLGFLRSMGVHHESLHYPMLDHIAAKIENAPARSRD
jgi:hypothetical protein